MLREMHRFRLTRPSADASPNERLPERTLPRLHAESQLNPRAPHAKSLGAGRNHR